VYAFAGSSEEERERAGGVGLQAKRPRHSTGASAGGETAEQRRTPGGHAGWGQQQGRGRGRGRGRGQGGGQGWREAPPEVEQFLYANLERAARFEVVRGAPRAAGGRAGFNNRGRNFTATVGNFNSYYGYRRASATAGDGLQVGARVAPGVWHDPRLELLGPEWFAGRRVLDVGCNAGYLTLSMAHRFGAASMLGIDCDADVVAQARRVKRGIAFPPGPPPAGAPPRPRVYFQVVDAVPALAAAAAALRRQDAGEEAAAEGGDAGAGGLPGGRFDVISLFSVTKWIHLRHGDAGLAGLLANCAVLLREGGVLLVEPQPWKSYRKRRNLLPQEVCPRSRPDPRPAAAARLSRRDETGPPRDETGARADARDAGQHRDPPGGLCQRDSPGRRSPPRPRPARLAPRADAPGVARAGFAHVQNLGCPRGLSKGFSRPVLACFKSAPAGPAASPGELPPEGKAPSQRRPGAERGGGGSGGGSGGQ
jgi:7SK snRNA methylphosphate capping enzyme